LIIINVGCLLLRLLTFIAGLFHVTTPSEYQIYYTLSASSNPLISPQKIKESLVVDDSQVESPQEVWRNSHFYTLLYFDVDKSFYIQVHEDTYPASGTDVKSKIFYEEWNLDLPLNSYLKLML